MIRYAPTGRNRVVAFPGRSGLISGTSASASALLINFSPKRRAAAGSALAMKLTMLARSLSLRGEKTTSQPTRRVFGAAPRHSHPARNQFLAPLHQGTVEARGIRRSRRRRGQTAVRSNGTRTHRARELTAGQRPLRFPESCLRIDFRHRGTLEQLLTRLGACDSLKSKMSNCIVTLGRSAFLSPTRTLGKGRSMVSRDKVDLTRVTMKGFVSSHRRSDL